MYHSSARAALKWPVIAHRVQVSAAAPAASTQKCSLVFKLLAHVSPTQFLATTTTTNMAIVKHLSMIGMRGMDDELH